MARINPYVYFNGNAEEAFNFYKKIFGGEFERVVRYSEFTSPEHPIAKVDANKIMHIALPVGSANRLMGADVLDAMGRITENDNRNTISISADSREEADKIFNGLAEGGKIEMPIADAPWGAYFGMLADRYGVQWMVDFSPAK